MPNQVERIVEALKARPALLEGVLKALLDDHDITVIMPWNDDSEPGTWYRRLRTGKAWVAKVVQNQADGRWYLTLAGIHEDVGLSLPTKERAERMADDLLRKHREGWVLL
jgi:hypothetical protein